MIIKRILDIGISAGLLVLISPILILASYLVFWDVGRPIFYRQVRSGKDGKPFTILKLRTMANLIGSGPESSGASDEERVSKIGKLLRRSSVDELPQLWNVMRGEMSLVGPRPLLTEYLDLYSDEERRRLWVRPGVTGLAQIQGRNAISWAEKFRWDLWYVDNWSLRLDIKILALTIFIVAKGLGVNSSEGVTMEKFTGHK